MMKNISIAIIDNDVDFISNLKNMISKIEGAEIIIEAVNFENAVQLLKKIKPDILLLDVELNNKTGFDVLNALDEIDFQTIFITAYQDYALEAIKFSAVDYLLKPFSQEELNLAIEKAKKNISNNIIPTEVLLTNFKNPQLHSKRLGLNTFDGIHFVMIEEIIRCKADGNYTEFYLLNDKKYVVSSPIKKFEDMLENYGFYRIHKSHLINLSQVCSYLKSNGGYVVMSDGTNIEVSRRKKDHFLESLNTL